MMNFLFIFILFLTIAITSGSILVASHLRISYKTNFFSTFLFFQIFYFTFGFYALWGQTIINTLLSDYVTAELLRKITDVTAFLGTPFLLFASLMFIRFTRELTGRKTRNSFVLLYILINVLVIIAIGYVLLKFPDLKTLTVIKYYYIIFSFLYTTTGVTYLFIRDDQTKLQYVDLKYVSFGFIIIMLIQNLILFFYKGEIYIALLFIFFFFLMGGFLPVYLKYKADLSKLLPEAENCKSFDEFCDKFEISKREKEIIYEICKGLTNQQIADKLFISLQTVKDHTHRIYIKADCTNRAQLIRMVNEMS